MYWLGVRADVLCDRHHLDEAHGHGAVARHRRRTPATSSSFWPRITTQFSLIGPRPAANAASMPARTRSSPGPARDRLETLGRNVSSEMLARVSPASRNGRASSASNSPLVESAMSSIPGVAGDHRDQRGKSRRISGSPPVRRMLRTPILAAARTIAAISS